MVPSSAIDSMNLGGIAGFIALVRARNFAVLEESFETSPGAVAAAHRFPALARARSASAAEKIEAALQDVGGGDAVNNLGTALAGHVGGDHFAFDCGGR
jgi:hypothetical protein